MITMTDSTATAAHTPGPWDRNIKPASKYPTVWSGRNTHVAYVAVSAAMDDAEIEANIRLIAAAPELLAALEELLAHIEWRRGRAGEKTGPQDCTHRARAAIVKAREGV